MFCFFFISFLPIEWNTIAGKFTMIGAPFHLPSSRSPRPLRVPTYRVELKRQVAGGGAAYAAARPIVVDCGTCMGMANMLSHVTDPDASATSYRQPSTTFSSVQYHTIPYHTIPYLYIYIERDRQREELLDKIGWTLATKDARGVARSSMCYCNMAAALIKRSRRSNGRDKAVAREWKFT